MRIVSCQEESFCFSWAVQNIPPAHRNRSRVALTRLYIAGNIEHKICILPIPAMATDRVQYA